MFREKLLVSTNQNKRVQKMANVIKVGNDGKQQGEEKNILILSQTVRQGSTFSLSKETQK
jgi:hypothetical protein